MKESHGIISVALGLEGANHAGEIDGAGHPSDGDIR